MSSSNTELNDALAAIDSAEDVVDLLVVLLSICRRHGDAVLEAYQDPTKRAELRKQAALFEDAATQTFTSRGLSDATREFAKDTLRHGAKLAVTARALALGINEAVLSRDKTTYRQLCRKWAVRELKDGDPYPTPSVDLSPMYGSGGFSSQPYSNAATEYDSVSGLALWRSDGERRLRVIYDTVAGAYLDSALGEAVDILAVSPNGSMQEFDFSSKYMTADGFFGIRLCKPRRQDAIVENALKKAGELEADIVVTPEMSSTTGTVKKVITALAGVGNSRPRIVVAGGTHMFVGKKRRNRLSTIYTDLDPYVVNHDKIGEYKYPLGGGKEWDEAIDRSNEVRIHAGVNWSMIPLICADFLEKAVLHAVAKLCPRLVVVPSMSPKTSDFEFSMAQVIQSCQALVAVVNGPHDWKPDQVPVLVVGMPLADPVKRTIRLSPAGSPAPYVALYSSLTRGATWV
jgi:hypothetical protein